MENKYDVFINYRRKTDVERAKVLYYALSAKGFKVFFDYNSLRDGNFNSKIFDAIDSAEYFIVLVSQGSFDNCSNPNDWVRKEIEYAISKGKKIIPVCHNLNDREIPTNLPSSLNSLNSLQISLLGSADLYDQSVDFMIQNRMGQPKNKQENEQQSQALSSLYNSLIQYTESIMGMMSDFVEDVQTGREVWSRQNALLAEFVNNWNDACNKNVPLRLLNKIKIFYERYPRKAYDEVYAAISDANSSGNLLVNNFNPNLYHQIVVKILNDGIGQSMLDELQYDVSNFLSPE